MGTKISTSYQQTILWFYFLIYRGTYFIFESRETLTKMYPCDDSEVDHKNWKNIQGRQNLEDLFDNSKVCLHMILSCLDRNYIHIRSKYYHSINSRSS